MHYMFDHRSALCLLVSIGFSFGSVQAKEAARVTGEQKKWHRVTVNLTGPATSENATPNPFRDYRLTVRFRHLGSKKDYHVPGYFAADGNPAETGADAISIAEMNWVMLVLLIGKSPIEFSL